MAENRHTKEELQYFQSLPLDLKIRLTEDRIRAWASRFGEDGICVSFSGGKDSTVLLDIVRNIYPNVRAVFCNTGLEYPEIRQFAMSHDNVDIVYPEMRFRDVITKYGYPLISKEVAHAIYYARHIKQDEKNNNEEDCETHTSRYEPVRRLLLGKCSESKTALRKRQELSGDVSEMAEKVYNRSMYNKEKYLPIAKDLPIKISNICCNKLKKAPMKKYQKVNGYMPILGTMAEESRVRKQGWLRTGCNAFDSKEPKSQPLSFWTNQDILNYIVSRNVKICSVYGDIVSIGEDGYEYSPTEMIGDSCKLKCTGCERTGCIFCGFGFHNEKGKTRFQRLAETHPRQYEYAMGGGEWVDNPDYDATAPKFDGEWENWNPKKIWIPSDKGLGLKKVFDLTNEIMGKDFYRYE